MKRKFIGERGAIGTPKVRQPRNVLYTFEEATEIFIRAKTAEGVRPGTITGYRDIFRYFQQRLDENITHINEITADTIRNYINYLRTERSPYAEDPQRKRSGKGLSVNTINIRIRGLSAFFRFLSTEGIIPDNPTENISQVRDDEHEEVPGSWCVLMQLIGPYSAAPRVPDGRLRQALLLMLTQCDQRCPIRTLSDTSPPCYHPACIP
jgi:integrase/recombinase XerD